MCVCMYVVTFLGGMCVCSWLDFLGGIYVCMYVVSYFSWGVIYVQA